ERVDRAVVGIDANPELRSRLLGCARVRKARLDPHGQERERRAVAEPRDVPPWIAELGEDGARRGGPLLRLLHGIRARPGIRRSLAKLALERGCLLVPMLRVGARDKPCLCGCERALRLD